MKYLLERVPNEPGIYVFTVDGVVKHKGEQSDLYAKALGYLLAIVEMREALLDKHKIPYS